MTDNRKISLCITNYNRVKMLFESFHQVALDSRIGEIVIVDDKSMPDYFRQVYTFAKTAPYQAKVVLCRNTDNLGCYRNKREVISQASNDFVIIFDSDNILSTEYIDKVFEQQ